MIIPNNMHDRRSLNAKILFSLAALLSSRTVCAQHVHAMSASDGRSMSLPILVDGSKNPEKISDALAYRHFFAAFAAHPAPTLQEQNRQSAQLGPLQLAGADQQAIVRILGSFRVQLDQIESAVAIAGTPAKLTSLQTQKTALVAATLANLKQALTNDGASRIDQYVQTRVKSHIVIYGGAM